MRKCSVASIPGQVIDSRITATASRLKFPLPVNRSHPSPSTRPRAGASALRTNADSPSASSGKVGHESEGVVRGRRLGAKDCDALSRRQGKAIAGSPVVASYQVPGMTRRWDRAVTVQARVASRSPATDPPGASASTRASPAASRS